MRSADEIEASFVAPPPRTTRALARVLATATLATGLAGCFESREVPLDVRDAAADVRLDAPSTLEGGTSDAGASCTAPPGLALTCADPGTTTFSGTTPIGPLAMTLPVLESTASGDDECPQAYSVIWDASAGSLMASRLRFGVSTGRKVFEGPITATDGCAVSLELSDGTVLASAPCTFVGCYDEGLPHLTPVLAGQLSVHADGFDLEATIGIPMCVRLYCL